MKSMSIEASQMEQVIEGSKDVKNAAFLVGQDPDEFKGGFDLSQVFKGDIAELPVSRASGQLRI